MMDKCREEFENWETSNGGAGYDYEVWQAAWNARDPAVLVEALEYYAKLRRYGEDGGLAREALAEWKGGLNE